MPAANLETVALLQALLDEACSGRLQDAFVLFRACDGTYGYEYVSRDVPDLMFELGTVILLERSA